MCMFKTPKSAPPAPIIMGRETQQVTQQQYAPTPITEKPAATATSVISQQVAPIQDIASTAPIGTTESLTTTKPVTSETSKVAEETKKRNTSGAVKLRIDLNKAPLGGVTGLNIPV